MKTQLQIEALAKKLANIQRAAGRNFNAAVERRMDKLNATIETLSLGQQLAVSTIAHRINDAR